MADEEQKFDPDKGGVYTLENGDKITVPPKPSWKPNPNGRRGADPAYLTELSHWKQQLQKIPEFKAMRGGRIHTKVTRAEAEEAALQRMMPKALKVLDEQLDDPDQRVRQSAALKVLEYVKGKPTQRVEQQVDQVQRIVYESAAYRPPSPRDVIEARVATEPLLLELPADEDASLTA